MADYCFLGSIVRTSKTGEVTSAPRTPVSFVDAETDAPVTFTVDGSTTGQTVLTTDEFGGFRFTKPNVDAVKPVVDGQIVNDVVTAVNADRLTASKVDAISVTATQIQGIAQDAATSAAQAAAYAQDATTASGQQGVLRIDGAALPIPVYVNPTNPAVLADGSLIMVDTSEVVVTPTAPTTTTPTTDTTTTPTTTPTTGTTTPTTGGDTGTTTPTTSASSGLPWLSGVYTTTTAAAIALETARGLPLDLFYAKLPVDSWANIQAAATKLTRPHEATRLVVQAPLWPASGTVETAAAGTDAAQWTQLAKSLRSGDALVVGREMNLDSTPWAATDANATNWRAAWGKAYDAIKAANPLITVIWAPDAGGSHTLADVRTVYVDGKVDVIGLVMWDWWPTDNTDANWAIQQSGDDTRLDGWMTYAKAKGVKVALIEWALIWTTPGGQDNPRFVHHILDWCRANAANVWGEVYHSTAEDGRSSQLDATTNPTSLAEYKVSLAGIKTGKLVPSMVSALRSTATPTTVTLAWQPAIPPAGKTITGYNIYSGTSATPVVTNQPGTTWTASGLTAKAAYSYRVVAVASDWTLGPDATIKGTTASADVPADSGTTIDADGWHLVGLVPLQRYNRLNVRLDDPNVPLDPNSDKFVAQFVDVAKHTPCQGINLNAYQYNCVYYKATKNTPRRNIQYSGAWASSDWAGFATGVPIDPRWTGSHGTDGAIAVYLSEAEGGGKGGTLWEWHVFKNSAETGGDPSAAHGGRILNVAYAEGAHEYPWGVSASGIAFPGCAITLREIRAGRIDHAVYIGAQLTQPGDVWPATRNDGWDQAPAWSPIEGQRWRLDPTVNVDTLPIGKIAKIIAKAIQQYGMVFCDKSGYDNSLCTESGTAEMLATGAANDPWDAILNGVDTWDVMDGFPMDKLQVVSAEYGKAQVDAWTTAGKAKGLPGGANW